MYTHKHDFSMERWSRTLGEASVILLNSDRKEVSIASLGAFVLPYARLGQLQIFYGYNGYPSGYLTWGYMTDAAISRLRSNPHWVPDIEDLNAGANIVLTDAISHLRDIRPMVAHIRKIASRSDSAVYALRPNRRQGGIALRRYR